MSATLQRDQASNLAKSNPKKALDMARKVDDPWFRAQALSWVARFTDGDPIAIASEAAKAAEKCNDDYKKSAVRAWEIAALAERGCMSEAGKRLSEAVRGAKKAIPASSRSEAFILLMQAAFAISRKDAVQVYEVLIATCSPDEHWRCKRAIRDGGRMISGELNSRSFFW
ncbi:MAG: hypothetical protein V4710_18255 [Verrucomicrobiota bacterium]